MREQRRIVDILEDHLSRLDAGKGYLVAARNRLTGVRRSTLGSLFGQYETSVTLSTLVSKIEAGKSFGSASRPAQGDEWGIIKVSAMTWGEFRPDENKSVATEEINTRHVIKPGDLLVSRANTSEYVGASVLVRETPPRLLLSDKSLRIVPKPEIDTEWLWRALQAPSARRQISAMATGTKDSMRNISQGALLRVQLPSVDAANQAQLVAQFSEIDSALSAVDHEIRRQEARSQRLRRSLLAAAFSGRLTGSASDFDRAKELER